jgi:hypothetical protein
MYIIMAILETCVYVEDVGALWLGGAQGVILRFNEPRLSV